MSRKHKRNMQHRVFESNIEPLVIEDEIVVDNPIVVEPIIEKTILQYNDRDFVVVENEGQVFPVKYARAKAMGYKVLRKHE